MDFAEEYVERYSFLVPQLTIEQPLYRYRSCIKYIIDEIKNDHIYLSDTRPDTYGFQHIRLY